MLKFVFGKGLQKRRRESDDTSRFIAEQVAISYADRTFTESVERLKAIIIRDVRAELDHLHNQFYRFVLGGGRGLPPNQRKPKGRITTVAQSEDGNPSWNLGSRIPSWAPRGSKYLARKWLDVGHKRWFAYKGHLVSSMAPAAGGAGGETLFEEIFGPVSVSIRRNNKGWGTQGGAMESGVLRNSGPSTRGATTIMPSQRGMRSNSNNAKHVQLQLATITVRALGSLNPGAINRDSLYGPGGPVSSWDQDVAVRLAGRASKYRPSLEPFLDFFFEKALGHAVSERIKRGTAASSLTRARR